MLLYIGLTFCIVLVAKCSELVTFQEAAFQGRCDHGSACDQLCYELHDGMYECACTYGYQLNTNGYSCQEINSTYPNNDIPSSNSEEDVLYQRGASFSAELDVNNNNTIFFDVKKLPDSVYSNNGKETSMDDSSRSDYDDEKGNDDGSHWIRSDNERHSSETATSAPLMKATTTSTSVDPSTTTIRTISTKTTVTLGPSHLSAPIDVDVSANEALNINLVPISNEKSNHHTLYVKNDSHWQQQRQKQQQKQHITLASMDDMAKSNANPAEYYQYSTDDLVKGKLNVPHFAEKSWLAFPVLRGAYKYVQLQFEFKPEKLNGVILLTGERDDFTGDFIAVLMNNGFIEFWFDCGSGIGKVVSAESVILNEWNTLIVYRYRWDAWILLNQGKRVQGRSKGLFSRITFREPIFLGGTGNITGVDKKISVSEGFVGCIRKFTTNEQEYIFAVAPLGNITQIFDVRECTTNHCDKSSYRPGKKCLSNELDTIPSFNGSSYLTFTSLGDQSLIWFELKMIFKAREENGILLYSGHNERGDYIALSLVMGYIEFMFDLGSGAAVLRSTVRLSMDKWHEVHISRTARLAVLKIDEHAEIMTISPKGFWHLSLPQNLFLGGVAKGQPLPDDLKERGSFKGCIQKVEINGRAMSIMSEAVGGSNVADCPHACTTRPCGSLAQCIPSYENYECVCSQFNDECNQQLINSKLSNASSQNNGPEQAKANGTTVQPQPNYTGIKSATTAASPNIKGSVLNEETPRIRPEPPSLINNQIEVSVMVPSIDTIEHDSVPQDAIHLSKSFGGSHRRLDANKKHLQMKHKSKYGKRRNGVCFSGDESYFHYHDEETKRHIINYNVYLNLRMKTYSANGVILWAGPHTGHGDGDYLMLGIENGYLHLRFDLGSGEINLQYNMTRINDGLWHRIRASRDSQEGTLEVDGSRPIKRTSRGELRKLNADTVLYVGGMPDVTYYTKRKYHFGIVGCISEIVLGGDLKLDLNNETHAKSRRLA